MGARPHFARLTPVGYRAMNVDNTIPDESDDQFESEEAREALEQARRRLAEAPAEVVVTNHAMGLFELAAIHLTSEPPNLEAARLAIDALGHLVDGLGPRLGEHHDTLQAALGNIRMVFVQRS